MNQLSIYTLKALRKLYAKAFSVPQLTKPDCIQDADLASQLIYDKLIADAPCMIARLGATELMTMVNYLGVHKKGKKSILQYIQGKELDWWWNKNVLQQMQNWSGFFPPTVEKIERFCEQMLDDMKEVDILGSWLDVESYFTGKLQQAERVKFHLLEPFWSKQAWTRALHGKTVLVVHPFAELIEKQYHNNRTKLFKNPDILPQFNLQTIKAVQSLGGESNGFNDWFEALDCMKHEIDKRDYDICLIGCGAYGFPLAAHVKRKGKKAVHLGGVLQILFGIRGNRWDNPNHEVKRWGLPYGFYPNLINEYWTRPADDLKPRNAEKVEGATYW
jgi:hypothetical protein